MKKIIAVIVAACLLLAGCGGTMVYDKSKGIFLEVPDKETAYLYYEYNAKTAEAVAKWAAIGNIDKDNTLAAMAVSFALGQNDKIRLTRFKTWDERLLPWAQMFFGWGGSPAMKTLMGETELSGNMFKVDGDHNNFEFYKVDSRRDTSFSANDSESTSKSTSVSTDYDRTTTIGDLE